MFASRPVAEAIKAVDKELAQIRKHAKIPATPVDGDSTMLTKECIPKVTCSAKNLAFQSTKVTRSPSHMLRSARQKA